MRGLNRQDVLGHVGGAPEVHEFEDGGKVATFSVAVNESWKGRDGEMVEHVEWFRVVVHGGLAEVVERYLGSGDLVFVSGSRRTRKYTDKDGVDRWSTELLARDFRMLGGRREDGAGSGTGASGSATPATGPGGASADDGLPF